jgi:uncharacterized protein YbaR (Trm112 family)
MIDTQLLDILCCPETKQDISVLGQDKLALLNQKILQGEIFNHNGEKVTDILEDALVRADGEFVFPIRNQIPVMLMGESISMKQLGI